MSDNPAGRALFARQRRSRRFSAGRMQRDFCHGLLAVVAAVACLVVPPLGPAPGTQLLAAPGASHPVGTPPQSGAPPPLSFALEPGLVDEVVPSSYAPHLLPGPYSETWSYLFSFPNGYTIMSRLTVTNRGPGDGRGAGIALIVDPSGRVTRQVNSRPQNRWTRTLHDDGVDLRVAGHQWSIRPPSHEVRMQSRHARFNIRATGLTDVYRPGRLRYTRDEFYDLTVLAPRLEASGTLQLGEKMVELKGGSGIAVHAYSNRDEQDPALSWLQFHTFDADLQVSLWELTAPKAFDHRRVGLLLLFDEGRLVRDQATYQRVYGDIRRDPESPHYPVPGRLTFDDDTTGQSMHGEVVLDQVHRLELVDLINSRFMRFLVRRLMEPVSYEFSGAYDLRVELAGQARQLSGTGIASLQIVDDPPAGRPW